MSHVNLRSENHPAKPALRFRPVRYTHYVPKQITGGTRAAAFVAAVREGRPSPIPLEELLEVSRVSIEIAASCGKMI